PERSAQTFRRNRCQGISQRSTAESTTLQYLDSHKPMGGTAGEGREDIRRHVRRSETPITSFEGFETFMFANPHQGSVFIDLLRQLSSTSPSRSGQHIVLKYGDLRPDNIMVELADNKYIISGILDWQHSGFILTITSLSDA
ncbi:hypothetical protein N7467_002351, partial [Penicillium canescens]